MTTITRRTVAKGAAWTVPVIAVGATAPMAAASVKCLPRLEVQPQSWKCCADGNTKGMHLVLLATDGDGCGFKSTDSFCITDVQLGNGKDPEYHINQRCFVIGDQIIIDFSGVQSCPHYLDVFIDGGLIQVATDNVPGASGDECSSLT